MDSVGDVIAGRPDLRDRFGKVRAKILGEPEIQQFIAENHLIDFQIEKSISAFSEYLQAKQDTEFYEPALQFNDGYALVRYRETSKKIEMKNQSKLLFLDKNSVVGDDSIKDARFDNFKVYHKEEQEAYNFAKACKRYYMQNEVKLGNSIMIGLPGTGKSHLSMSILKEFSKSYRKALFLNLPKTLDLIMDSWDTGSKFSVEYIKHLCSESEIVVLDDIGTERGTKKDVNGMSWSDNVIISILNERQDKGLIVTSNLSREELRTRYSQQIFSRLFRDVPEDSPRYHIFKNISDKRINTVN